MVNAIHCVECGKTHEPRDYPEPDAITWCMKVAYRNGAYTMPAPPVVTNRWEESDWIRWIVAHGSLGTLPGAGFQSWNGEVVADNSGKFCGNGMFFRTKEEAIAHCEELSMRWFAVRTWRAVESVEPVNYEFVDDRARMLKREASDGEAKTEA